MRRRTAQGGGAIGTAHGLPVRVSGAKCRPNDRAVVCPRLQTSGHSEHVALCKSERDAQRRAFEAAKPPSKSGADHDAHNRTQHTAYLPTHRCTDHRAHRSSIVGAILEA